MMYDYVVLDERMRYEKQSKEEGDEERNVCNNVKNLKTNLIVISRQYQCPLDHLEWTHFHAYPTVSAKAFLIFETIYQVEILCSFSCKIQFLDGVEGESN
ncbi:hypothetical protein GQ457_13G001290 [Hibiscus cannabinus]